MVHIIAILFFGLMAKATVVVTAYIRSLQGTFFVDVDVCVPFRNFIYTLVQIFVRLEKMKFYF